MSLFAGAHEYIKGSWLKAVRKRDNRKDFILPYDFIPPCIDGELTDLYYWDTYFTNKGLYIDGLSEYAFKNIENLKFCLERFGCVPNMCRSNGADYASQPPLLSFMINDHYEYSQDKLFLADGYKHLVKEYIFWDTKRKLGNGLNCYGSNQSNFGNAFEGLKEYAERCNVDLSEFEEEKLVELRKNKTAEGESGEDHTPRFRNKAGEIAPVDLNSYLYGFERLMAKFSSVLENGRKKDWEKRAEYRLGLMKKYCYDQNSGVFFDYNVKEGKKTFVYCAAGYVPFAVGVSEESKGVRAINEKLLLEHGVTSCEKMETKEQEVFQWGYPNMWAPHNYWAYLANKNVGLSEKAWEICKKYLNTVSDVFARTGKMFEKYDARTGDKAIFNEYGLPEMLGWTAGVFEEFYKEYYKEKNRDRG